MRPLALLALLGSLGCAVHAERRTAATPVSRTAEIARPAADDLDPALLRDAGVDPAALRCNRENRWGDVLPRDAERGAAELMAALAPSFRDLTAGERAEAEKRIRKALMWRMVRAVILEGDNNNLGVIALRGRTWVDETGARRPLLVYRTGLTPAPDAPGSCFGSLLSAGHVRHVVNLFDGDIPAEDLVEAEARAARAAGASYHTATDAADGYGPWRDQLRKHYDDPAIRARASRAIARLIREQILMPDGRPPRGNLHVHCGGGMHRTGMVVALLEKCVNRAPMEVVEAHYRLHVGYRDRQHPGGYEEGNLRFVREFDCSLL